MLKTDLPFAPSTSTWIGRSTCASFEVFWSSTTTAAPNSSFRTVVPSTFTSGFCFVTVTPSSAATEASPCSWRARALSCVVSQADRPAARIATAETPASLLTEPRVNRTPR